MLTCVGIMPLSKKRDRERKRRDAKAKRPNTISKRDVRALKAAGVAVEDVVGEPPSEKVSGRVVNAIVRRLEAKRARVEWQSGGIKMLHNEIATLKAERDTLRSVLSDDKVTYLEKVYGERIAALSYEVAQLQAESIMGEITKEEVKDVR